MNRLSFILVLVGTNYFSKIQCYNNYDDYVLESYKDCNTDRRTFSCSRYRLAKFLWSLNLSQLGKSFTSNYDIVSLNVTQNDAEMFPEARYSSGIPNKQIVVVRKYNEKYTCRRKIDYKNIQVEILSQ